ASASDAAGIDAAALDAAAIDAAAVVDAAHPDAAMPTPWPPPELALGPADRQPSGPGWRTAQWNICTTSMDGGRLECRARIAPGDSGRTAAQLERAAIA